MTLARIVSVLVAAMLLLTACQSNSGSADSGDAGTAQIMCRNFVKDQLKSPGSADFSGESPEEAGPQTWSVTGSVDSENSFGAMIRNDYVCRIRYTGNDNWRLLRLRGLAN